MSGDRTKYPATFYFRARVEMKEAVESFRLRLQRISGEPKSEAEALRTLLWEALKQTENHEKEKENKTMAGKIQATSKVHAATARSVHKLMDDWDDEDMGALAVSTAEAKAIEKFLKACEKKGEEPLEAIASRKEAIKTAKKALRVALKEADTDSHSIQDALKLVG